MNYKEVRDLIVSTGKKLKLDNSQIERIAEPERIVELNLPVKMDDGKVKVFQAVRVQHNNARGPYKGGLRYHPEVNTEEVKVLAALMSLKTALINIPFGGGKGGISVNPRELSKAELKRLTESLARGLADVIGDRKDVPAPDVNTDPQIMKWFRKEYEKVVGQSEPGVITGKALNDGGIKVRDEATGLGGAAVIQELARVLNKKPSDTTVAIQGFGNVGNHLAHHLYHMGFRVIAIADVDSGIMHEDGLDYHETYKKNKSGDKLAECCICDLHGPSKDCINVGPKEVLEAKCDILVPAAIGDQITKENAAKIKAKIIVELANHPITDEAEKILDKMNVMIVPDILANAGGVLASYFEWQENVEDVVMSYEEGQKALIRKMKSALRDVLKTAENKKTSLREASYIIAISRIAKALKI